MVHRLAKAPSAASASDPSKGPIASPGVVGRREHRKVQPEAEGYQGRSWGPLLRKTARLRARSQVVLGSRERLPQSRTLHPTPPRPARERWVGAAPATPPEPQGQGVRRLPRPLRPRPLEAALGRREPVGAERERRPALSRTPGGDQGARVGERRAAEAKDLAERRSQDPTTQRAGWGRGAPYLGQPRRPAGGSGRAGSRRVGARPGLLGVPDPRPWRAAGLRGAHGSGARSLAGSAWARGARPAGRGRGGAPTAAAAASSPVAAADTTRVAAFAGGKRESPTRRGRWV